MSLDIFLIVVVTSIIQSIFGVGVLLFGTPILLALGYDFISAIVILLPISLTINILQATKDYKKIDFKFYKKIIIYAVPFIVFFLFMVAALEIRIEPIVGVLLLLIAIKEYSHKLNYYMEPIIRHEKIFLIIMGGVHGVTNLGGSLLTAIIHGKKYEKNVARATVAISYATFAFFQLVTLLFVIKKSEVDFIGISYCLSLGIIVFLITEVTIYMEINNQKYNKLFSIFLFGSGVLLCIKSI
jgi:hypothetical protein